MRSKHFPRARTVGSLVNFSSLSALYIHPPHFIRVAFAFATARRDLNVSSGRLSEGAARFVERGRRNQRVSRGVRTDKSFNCAWSLDGHFPFGRILSIWTDTFLFQTIRVPFLGCVVRVFHYAQSEIVIATHRNVVSPLAGYGLCIARWSQLGLRPTTRLAQ